MITEDYVSFETAKLLKEKGFNEYCPESYFKMDKTLKKSGFSEWEKVNEIKAPTQSLAMKWLREIYQIDIQVFRHIRGKRITFYARIEQNTHLEHQDKCNLYQSYEQACEAAIKYCLENLIIPSSVSE